MLDALDVVVGGLVCLCLIGLAVAIFWPLEPRGDRARWPQ